MTCALGRFPIETDGARRLPGAAVLGPSTRVGAVTHPSALLPPVRALGWSRTQPATGASCTLCVTSRCRVFRRRSFPQSLLTLSRAVWSETQGNGPQRRSSFSTPSWMATPRPRWSQTPRCERCGRGDGGPMLKRALWPGGAPRWGRHSAQRPGGHGGASAVLCAPPALRPAGASARGGTLCAGRAAANSAPVRARMPCPMRCRAACT